MATWRLPLENNVEKYTIDMILEKMGQTVYLPVAVGKNGAMETYSLDEAEAGLRHWRTIMTYSGYKFRMVTWTRVETNDEMTTAVRINQNSHTAAMCETQHPNLCEKHLAEVRNDGDLLEVLATNQDALCDMCKIDEAIRFENRCPVCGTPESLTPNEDCSRCRAHKSWEKLDALLTRLIETKEIANEEELTMFLVVALDPMHMGATPGEGSGRQVDWGALIYALRMTSTLARNLADRYEEDNN